MKNDLFKLVPLGYSGFNSIMVGEKNVGFVVEAIDVPEGKFFAHGAGYEGVVFGDSAKQAAERFLGKLLWIDAREAVMVQAAKAKAENDAFIAGRSAPVVFDGRDFAMGAA